MYKHILLPVDITQKTSWHGSLPVALKFCEVFDSYLHILTVIPDFGMSIVGNFFPDNYEARALDEAKAKLSEFIKSNIPQDIKVQKIVAVGTVYQEIINTAVHIEADLIVMNSHRPELKDYLLGPNTARVVRHGKTSVHVVRDFETD